MNAAGTDPSASASSSSRPTCNMATCPCTVSRPATRRHPLSQLCRNKASQMSHPALLAWEPLVWQHQSVGLLWGHSLSQWQMSVMAPQRWQLPQSVPDASSYIDEPQPHWLLHQAARDLFASFPQPALQSRHRQLGQLTQTFWPYSYHLYFRTQRLAC